MKKFGFIKWCVVAIGLLIFFLTTSRGMLFAQHVFMSKKFSVGSGEFFVSDSWLLLDLRRSKNESHLKLGVLVGSEDDGLPPGAYYSFRDVDFNISITFIELDESVVRKITSNFERGIGCMRLLGVSNRNLLRCDRDGGEVMLYDLDRMFLVVISAKNEKLVERVVSVIH